MLLLELSVTVTVMVRESPTYETSAYEEVMVLNVWKPASRTVSNISYIS